MCRKILLKGASNKIPLLHCKEYLIIIIIFGLGRDSPHNISPHLAVTHGCPKILHIQAGISTLAFLLLDHQDKMAQLTSQWIIINVRTIALNKIH